MVQSETVIDYVSGWEERQGQPNSVLHLRQGLILFVTRNDPRFEAWHQAATVQQKLNAPVYVQFNQNTRSITTLYMSLARIVESVEIRDSKRMTIVFRQAPSFYFLSNNQPHFGEMAALLQAAAKSHREVLVVSHPSTLEILDVRLPDQ